MFLPDGTRNAAGQPLPFADPPQPLNLLQAEAAYIGQSLDTETAIYHDRLRSGQPQSVYDDQFRQNAHNMRLMLRGRNERIVAENASIEFWDNIARQEREMTARNLNPNFYKEEAQRIENQFRRNTLRNLQEQNRRAATPDPPPQPTTTQSNPPPSSVDNTPALRTPQTSGTRAPNTATARPRPASPSTWGLYQPVSNVVNPVLPNRTIPRPAVNGMPASTPRAANARLGYGAAGGVADFGIRLANGQDVGQAAFSAAGGIAGGLAGQGIGQAIGAGLGFALGGPPGAAVGGSIGGTLGGLVGGTGGSIAAGRYYPGNNAPLPGAPVPGTTESVPIPQPFRPNPLGVSPGSPLAPSNVPAAGGLLGSEQIWDITFTVSGYKNLDGSDGFYQGQTGPHWGSPPVLSLVRGTHPSGNPAFSVKIYTRGGTFINPNGSPAIAPLEGYVLGDQWLGGQHLPNTTPVLTVTNQAPISYAQPNPPPAIPRPVDPAYTPTPQNAPRTHPANDANQQYHPNPIPQASPSPTGRPAGEPDPGNLGGGEPELVPQRPPDGTPQPGEADRAYPNPNSPTGGNRPGGGSSFPTIPVFPVGAPSPLPAQRRARVTTNARRPQPTALPRGAGPPNQPPRATNPQEPCSGNRCAQRQLEGINGANNRLDQLTAAMQVGDNLANAEILRKLAEINAKLGAQLPGGGIANFLKRLWDASGLQKVINILTWVTVMHNSLMLSNAVKESLFSAFDVALNFFRVELQDSEGEQIDTRGFVGQQLENFFKSLFGDQTVESVQKQWRAWNRIYQASLNLFYTLQSLFYSTIEGLEVIADRVSVIANAMRKWGVVGERAFGWMNPKNNFFTSKFAQRAQAAQEVAEVVEQVFSSLVDLRETGAELGNQSVALERMLRGRGEDDELLAIPDEPIQFEPIATIQLEEREESVKPLIPIFENDEQAPLPPET